MGKTGYSIFISHSIFPESWNTSVTENPFRNNHVSNKSNNFKTGGGCRDTGYAFFSPMASNLTLEQTDNLIIISSSFSHFETCKCNSSILSIN